jgi:hypothetical protein
MEVGVHTARKPNPAGWAPPWEPKATTQQIDWRMVAAMKMLMSMMGMMVAEAAPVTVTTMTMMMMAVEMMVVDSWLLMRAASF